LIVAIGTERWLLSIREARMVAGFSVSRSEPFGVGVGCPIGQSVPNGCADEAHKPSVHRLLETKTARLRDVCAGVGVDEPSAGVRSPEVLA